MKVFTHHLLISLSCCSLASCMIVRNPSQDELAALDQPPATILNTVANLLPKVETWYAELETQLTPSARTLSEQEMQYALKLGVPEPEKIRILVMKDFPMPQDQELLSTAKKYGMGNAAEGGRSVGYLILLKPHTAQRAEVIRHEMMHIVQMHRLGKQAFFRRYLIELEMMGYARSPLELEAYAKQGGS